MAKQILLIVLLTIAAILFKTQLDAVLNFTVSLHDHIIGSLSSIFSSDGVGKMIQASLALLLIPAVLGLVVSTVYWLSKKSSLPYTMHIVWVSWLVLLTTFTLKGV